MATTQNALATGILVFGFVFAFVIFSFPLSQPIAKYQCPHLSYMSHNILTARYEYLSTSSHNPQRQLKNAICRSNVTHAIKHRAVCRFQGWKPTSLTFRSPCYCKWRWTLVYWVWLSSWAYLVVRGCSVSTCHSLRAFVSHHILFVRAARARQMVTGYNADTIWRPNGFFGHVL